jgi:hypothetical protein
VDVSVQDRLRVAQDLVVDPAQAVVAARALHRLADQGEVEEELRPPLPVEVGQVVDGRVVGEEQRVAR